MKTIKRWTAFLLCCALVLACVGCAGAEAPASGSGSSGGGIGGGVPAPGGKGRYVETDITPPDAQGEQLHSFLAEDGALECYNWDLTKKFTSTDGGENWQESDGPGAGGTLTGRVQACTRLASGSLLVAMSNNNGSTTGLVRLAPDGTTQPFPVAPLDEAIETGPSTHIGLLRAVSEDRLLLNFFSGDFGTAPEEEDGGDDDAASVPGGEDASTAAGGANGEYALEGEGSEPASAPEEEEEENTMAGFVVGGEQIEFTGLIDLASGEVIAEYPEWFGISAAADADTLYLLGYGGEVTAKALADGKPQTKGEGKVAAEQYDFSMQMATGPNGMYILTSKNIQTMNAEGAASVLVDGSSYSFSAVGNMARALHLLPGGDMVAQMDNDAGSRLYRYRWDENAVLDPDKVLNVWSLNENPLVRTAISAMRAQNPDVVVEYEVALSQGGGVTAEDAIKTLNTRLLNGDGPDVLILDGTPAESYAARGMLQDLNSVVDTGGLFPNIAAPFATTGGTFYLPTNMKIPVLLGTRENLDKAAGLEQLIQMVQSGNPLPELTEGYDVFSSLPQNTRPALIPETLREMYDLLWNSGAASVITPEGLDKYGTDEFGMVQQSGSVSMGYSGGMVAQISGSPVAYASQRALLGAYLVDDLAMLDMVMEPPETALAAFPGLGEGSFVPMGLAGISADSPRGELAAQFVNLMLSEEVQGTKTGSGLPVTEAGMKKQIADQDELLQQQPTPERFEFDYLPLVNLAQTPQMGDETVSEMIWSAAQSLFSGEMDVEGAVAQLEQELRNYLAERQ